MEMKRYLSLVSLMILTGTLLAAHPAEAGPCRPFKLTAVFQFSDFVFDEDGNPVSATATGRGKATHLGRFTALGTDEFSPPVDGIVVIDGDATLTAANGDQLVVNFDGSVLDLSTGIGMGTYIFTGGSGRFADASGSADFEAVPNAADPSLFDLTAKGTLCY